MVKASSSKSKNSSSNNSTEPEVIERKRLKKLAFKNNLLSETQIKTYSSSLPPSKTVLKHHGADILRKSQRKNRYLFSFPGLISPIASGGKIGELKDLGTKNPILYLLFPQGQLKLFGTILYPKNRYLSLQFSRGGKNAMCEDYFDNMIVFSEAWWIGTKEENPEEARLDFPKEFLETQGQQAEYDFKGGAGATGASVSVIKQVVHRSGKKYLEEDSPETELEDDFQDDMDDVKDLQENTPVRHSSRTAGKTFKFADVSSGEDSVKDDADDTEIKEKGKEENKVKSVFTSSVVFDLDNEDANEENQEPTKLESESKKKSESTVSAKSSKKHANSSCGSLVQATISTLFSKVNDKLKEDEKTGEPRKRAKVTKGKTAGTGVKAKKKVLEVEDDDIEEFSSSTQGNEGSDEDWEA